jgi:hypothetical protein
MPSNGPWFDCGAKTNGPKKPIKKDIIPTMRAPLIANVHNVLSLGIWPRSANHQHRVPAMNKLNLNPASDRSKPVRRDKKASAIKEVPTTAPSIRNVVNFVLEDPFFIVVE